MDDIAALSAPVGRWSALVVVVAGGIALTSPDTSTGGGTLVLHDGLGLALGYGVARASGTDVPARRANSIGVGMRNSGLATVHSSPAAALPAAVFSVWHTLSGSLLAGWWARRDPAARPDRDEASAPGR